MVKPFILKTFLARLAGLEPATRGLENRIVVILIVPQNKQNLNLDRLPAFFVSLLLIAICDIFFKEFFTG